jgi:hypothetical protein
LSSEGEEDESDELDELDPNPSPTPTLLSSLDATSFCLASSLSFDNKLAASDVFDSSGLPFCCPTEVAISEEGVAAFWDVLTTYIRYLNVNVRLGLGVFGLRSEVLKFNPGSPSINSLLFIPKYKTINNLYTAGLTMMMSFLLHSQLKTVINGMI